MANVKLGNKIYENVETVKLDTADGGTVEFADRDAAVEAGKQEAYDKFWDAYQDGGNRTNYVEAFCRAGWDETTYNPKYPIIGSIYGLQSLFSNAFIVDTKVPTILRGGGQMAATFNYCTKLKRIAHLILEIPAITTSTSFQYCRALEEINVECVGDGCFAEIVAISESPKLTTSSVDSIINALKDLTEQTAKTVSFHAEVGAKLTEEQKAAITAKNWTLVY